MSIAGARGASAYQPTKIPQAFSRMLSLGELARLKKKSRNMISVRCENWRQPTLAQAIQALPSARLRLTAEFGMGSGRTTALWPPKNCLGQLSLVSGQL